ncbi:MAG: matrixin family metalloprotease [Calditrichaeota bacterium]|nr:matrixin family metalloprotease [Calditrichota bacterium]MCB9366934.1 matrixin family metalloprotease [Calditrichota bacterium]
MRHMILLVVAAGLVGMIWLLPGRVAPPAWAFVPETTGIRAPLAVCFDEGTDPDYVAEWTRRLRMEEGVLDYNLDARWESTANGPTGVQGNPIVLTYSFLPDGVTIQGTPSRLYQRMNQLFGNEQAWQDLFAEVFGRWSELSGITYVQVPDDGASFSNNSPGILGVRGDVRIGMVPVDGASGVLAYNYFPDRGDMVLDSEENWASATNNYRFFRNIVAHEHGHGIGMSHVCPANSTKLLEPFYSSAFDGPQHDDVLAGQRGYGDRYEPNDSQGAAYDLGSVEGVLTLSNVSLDDDTDQDWWQFNIQSNRALTIVLSPDGYEYLEGEQNFDDSCQPGVPYNTADNQNLNLTLTTADGVTLVEANTMPVGAAEQIFRYNPPQGQTSFKVQVNGATTNNVQLYRLTIEAVDPATPYLSGCPLEVDSTLLGTPSVGAILLTNPQQAGQLTIGSLSVTGPFTVAPTGTVVVAPGEELPVVVTFAGEPEGLSVGELTILHDGPGGVLTCEVTSFAYTSSIVLFTGAEASFGEVPVGTTDSVLVGFRSLGNVPLWINSMTTQPPFSISFDGPVSLSPGPLLRVYPHVAPTALGEVRGWLVINHSAESSPDSIELIATGVEGTSADDPVLLPREFALYQNYPNPFNATTNIEFDLPRAAPVSLKLYNIAGQLVRELVNEQDFAAGRHVVKLDASGLASGLYFYRFAAADYRADRKLLFLK